MEKLNKKISKTNNNDDSFLFSSSLIFDENIDKLWLHLRDIELETAIIDYTDNFKYIKGDNTWTAGNSFSIYWVGVSGLKFKCLHTKVDRVRKKIKWKCILDIGINYYKTLILYRITQSNKTLVKAIYTKYEKGDNLIDFSQSMSYYKNLQHEIFIKHSKYLKNLKNDIISYGSVIVDKNYLEVWKYLNDFKKINELSPIILRNIEYKGPINKPGSFIKFFFENIQKIIFLKIKSYSMSKHKKTWFIQYEYIGSKNNNIPKITEFRIVIINNDQTQVSFLHTFNYHTNSDYLFEFDFKKKNAIKNIKKYIEENDYNIVCSQNNELNNNINTNNQK